MLKFDQFYCNNELLLNDVLLSFKVLLGDSWAKEFEISHASQILTNDCRILVLAANILVTSHNLGLTFHSTITPAV